MDPVRVSSCEKGVRPGRGSGANSDRKRINVTGKQFNVYSSFYTSLLLLPFILPPHYAFTQLHSFFIHFEVTREKKKTCGYSVRMITVLTCNMEWARRLIPTVRDGNYILDPPGSSYGARINLHTVLHLPGHPHTHPCRPTPQVVYTHKYTAWVFSIFGSLFLPAYLP